MNSKRRRKQLWKRIHGEAKVAKCYLCPEQITFETSAAQMLVAEELGGSEKDHRVLVCRSCQAVETKRWSYLSEPQEERPAHRTCRVKIAWGTEEQAKHRAEADTRKNGVPLTHYHCEHCGKWHITKVVMHLLYKEGLFR